MAAQQPISVYTDLEALHGSLGTASAHAERWATLADEFKARYGRPPAWIARAPGRVNLIGEHIDYALFGVFPAAVERDILIACAPRPLGTTPAVDSSSPKDATLDSSTEGPGSVQAQNLHSKYEPRVFAPVRRKTMDMFKAPRADADPSDAEVHAEQWHLDIDKSQLRWESYVKAGYYGVLNHYYHPLQTGEDAAHPVPVDLLVTGSVPAGSGLSSSAAMVVASTLAFLAVNGKLDDPSAAHSLTKGALVELAMENEKRVGVNSGGMDQAASVISSAGAALYVRFFPKLAADPTPLPGLNPITSSNDAAPTSAPPGAVFIVANSLVVSDKVVSAKHRYNLRVVETLVAARALGRALGVGMDADGKREKITLREVLGRWLGADEVKGGTVELDDAKLKDGLQRLSQECNVLKPRVHTKNSQQLGVTLEEMIELSGLSTEEFEQLYLSWVDIEATHFQLYKRARHVLDEAWRVLEFRDVCALSASAQSSGLGETLQRLGTLMNESQASCTALFECSCPELDELTRIARDAGAYGSRLTGAGWGGCTVSLVDEARADEFVARVRAAYAPFSQLEGEALHEVLFATKPSNGACLYRFTQ